MSNLQTHIIDYLDYCRCQKRLDEKTLKAYRIDLTQFQSRIPSSDIPEITSPVLETFIAGLHQKYRPKTVKRKIASLKALFHYLEYKEIIDRNPFSKIQVKFREPVILPKRSRFARWNVFSPPYILSTEMPGRTTRRKIHFGILP